MFPVRKAPKLAAWGCKAQNSEALPRAVRRACRDRCPRGGSKLIFSSFSWHPSRRVRVLIAIGLGIIGAALVWAALIGPPAPDSALAPAPNGDGMPSTSPRPSKATPERPTERADHVRDQITGLVLPESEPVAVSIRKLGVRSTLVDLGLDSGRSDGGATRPCPRWLVLWRARTRCTRAGRHRRARDLGWRTCGLSPPKYHSARRSSDRYSKGWENCRLCRYPGGPILQVAVPEPSGLRPNQSCWTATDHLWRHLRRSQTQVPGQRRCLRQARGGTRACG